MLHNACGFFDVTLAWGHMADVYVIAATNEGFSQDFTDAGDNERRRYETGSSRLNPPALFSSWEQYSAI
ncbi:hypothetical protein EAI_03240 [Harpegnathos saltator]|uniref:Uncharacterized protein n=1 Tax=Harpegnathos saltator TaxID=610380 RepID=E2BGC9_HARSA|nr:hypothetical protein EAI_03240 [Harpegnathos saltator]